MLRKFPEKKYKRTTDAPKKPRTKNYIRTGAPTKKPAETVQTFSKKIGTPNKQ